MAFSYVEYIADGNTVNFSIPFDYIAEKDIKVFLDGVGVSFTFSSPSTIVTGTTPPAGVIVRIERETDISQRAVDFSSGSLLTEKDLDTSNIQVFYAAQEAIDTSNAALSISQDGLFDGQSRRIKNVADPVNPQDVATKNYLETEWLTLSDKAQLNALSIPNLNRVHQSITELDRVHASIGNVDRVFTSVDKLDRVFSSVNNIDRVHTSIANIDRVDTSIDNIDRVHTSIDNLDRVYTSITNIDRVDQSIDNVDRVALSADKLDRVHTSISNVDRVNTSIDAVDTVAADLNEPDGSEIETVAASIDNVNEVGSAINDVITVSANIVEVGDVAANKTNINAAVANQSNINAAVANESNINAAVANETNINAAVSNELNINTVSTNITDVNTTATNIADVNTVAANITDVQVASTNIADIQKVSTEVQKVIDVAADLNEITSEIDTVANSIANVDAVGLNIQNVINVDNNKANIDAAVANEANINAVASNETNINAAVANEANITAAATNELNINAAVANEANINAAVANEANINSAVANETAITTVATNIQNLQDFFDTYFVSSTAPTTATEGDLWYDTNDDILKVYNGGSWQNAGSSVNGVQKSEGFTATEGQTTFTIAEGYDAGYLTVFLNGVLQVDTTDYSAIDGSTITFTSPLSAGDDVYVLAFGTFQLADHYSKAALDNGGLDGRYYTKTQSDAQYMPIDAVTLPDQTGHAGQYLTTDGTSADWADVPPSVTSDIHVFYTDANGDLIWKHGQEVTDLQDANGNDLYDLVIVGSTDQTYSVDPTTGNLQVTIG